MSAEANIIEHTYLFGLCVRLNGGGRKTILSSQTREAYQGNVLCTIQITVDCSRPCC